MTLKQSGILLLSAPPGSGKTTQVPIALMDRFEGKVIILQPRRVAARSVARWMANQLGEKVGLRVGYEVRFEKKIGDQTQIEVLTEGLLIQRLLSDPELTDVSCVILDEFHERSVFADLCLTMLQEVRDVFRPELTVLIMSATLDLDALSLRLQCPVITIDGYQFPVKIQYDETLYSSSPLDRVSAEILLMWRRLHESNDDQIVVDGTVLHGGSILIFLPGLREIQDVHKQLKQANATLPIYELSGSHSAHAQDQALSPSSGPRIILSTNISETSITVEGVRVVIDTGLVRIARYTPRHGLTRLFTQACTQDEATQRAGRAGRVGPGLCRRLWTEHSHTDRPAHLEPEICRVDPAHLLLTASNWSGGWSQIEWLTPPPHLHIETAITRLNVLGALEKKQINSEKLSPIGTALSYLPLDPSWGATLLYGTRLDCLKSLSYALAIAQEGKDPLPIGHTHSQSIDFWTRVQLLDRADEGDFPYGSRRSDIQHLLRVARQIRQRSKSLFRDDPSLHQRIRDRIQSIGDIHQLCIQLNLQQRCALSLTLGAPDHIFKLRATGSQKAQRCFGAELHLATAPIQSDLWWVALHYKGLRQSRKAGGVGHQDASVTIACAIDPEWIPYDIEHQYHFDQKQGRLCEQEVSRFGSLIIKEVTRPLPRGPQAEAALIAIISESPSLLPLSESAKHWLTRVRWLANQRDHQDLFPDEIPTYQELEVPSNEDPLIVAMCTGCSSIKELTQVDHYSILIGLAPSWLPSLVSRYAPTHIELPTGQRVPLKYSAVDPPILSAPIQAFFGPTPHPTIMMDRVSIRLELLAPNRKVAAVTSDIARFWDQGYLDARRTLRGRYPKHDWPEDPRSARPQRGSKKAELARQKRDAQK